LSDKSTADFMQDQVQALLASPTLARVAERHSEGSDDPADFAQSTDELDESTDELDSDRDTKPNFDVQMLRAALRLRLK